MKNRTLIPLKYLFALMVSIVALTGCKEQNLEHSLSVSGDAYTFDGDGTSSYKINVNTTSAWTHTIEGAWVIEKSKDDKSITIGAKPNDTAADRTAKITIISGQQTQVISLRQLPGGANAARYRTIDDFTPAAMSPGGVYIAGVITSMEGEAYFYTPVIIEVATGKRTVLPITSEPIAARAITDKGLLVCSINNMYAIMYNLDGTSYDPTTLADHNKAIVEGVSADGSVIVGYVQGRYPNNKYKAVKWTDGAAKTEPTILKSPELNSWREPIKQGVMARGCSADGSIIYGTEWDKMAPIYWTADGEPHNAGDDLFATDTGIIYNAQFDKEMEVVAYSSAKLEASVNNMSANGKYLAFKYAKNVIADKAVTTTTHPVVFNIETGESTVITECLDGTGMTALDDGTLAYGTPSRGVMEGFMVYPGSTTAVPTDAWFKTKYGLIIGQNMPIEKVSVGQTAALCWRPRPGMFGVTYMYSYIFTPKQ